MAWKTSIIFLFFSVNLRKLPYSNIPIYNFIFRWYFWASGDYGFGFFYAGPNKEDLENESLNMKMIFPQMTRLPGPNHVPEKDEVPCEKVGFYKLEFSNKFSWFHSLEIDYAIEVLPPSGTGNWGKRRHPTKFQTKNWKLKKYMFLS